MTFVVLITKLGIMITFQHNRTNLPKY